MPYTDPVKAKECATRYRKSLRGRESMKRRNKRYRSVPENVKKLKLYGYKYNRSEKGRKVIRTSLLKRYNLTLEQYDSKLAEQGGMCAFCNLPPTPGVNLDVDHDHACCNGILSCGQCVRGLLHRKCNRMVGTIETYGPAVIEYQNRYKRVA